MKTQLNRTIVAFRSALVLMIAFSSASVHAQQNYPAALKSVPIASEETVFVHANATTFVPGETLLYKIYCVNPSGFTPSAVSKIAYAEIYDTARKVVFSQKLFLDNGIGQGDFFVPAALPSGTYKFVAYTAWMQNKPKDKYFEMPIFVINPFDSNSGKLASDNSAPESRVNTASTGTENFSGKSYSARELVTFRPQTAIPAGNYSLSVRRKENLPAIPQTDASAFVNSHSERILPIITGSEVRLPELRGELISGTVKSKTAGNVANKIVSVSIVGENFALRNARTDASGRFYINIEKYYPASEIIIQIIDEKRDDFTITLDNHVGTLQVPVASLLRIDKSMQGAIEERSIASQIQNAYAINRNDSIVDFNYPAFYEPLGKTYKLDDYTRFPSFKETIVEVLTEVYYTRENDQYQLHLRDYTTQLKINEPVLVLADGLKIQNLNTLFEYNMENVEKVTIVPGGYIYGAATYSGIIHIITKNRDFATIPKNDHLVKPNTLRPAPTKIYYTQKYVDPAKFDRIPDYRLQLLWEPRYDPTQNDATFYTSDVKGIFEVSIEGFTSSGQPISVKETFEVK